MSDVFLIFSEQAKNRPFIEREDTSRAVRPIQNHVVICDANSGEIYEATSLGEDPATYKWPDKEVKGPFNRQALVYLEYSTGKASDIDWQCERNTLTTQQMTNVQTACARHFG